MNDAALLEETGPAGDRAGSALARHALLAVVAGGLLDVGIRGGPANAVVAAGIVVTVAALGADGRLQQAEARWLAGAAVVPAAFLAVRMSPWLVTSNVLAVAALLGTAIVFARSGSVVDTTPLRLVHRAVPAVARAVRGLHVLAPLLPRLDGGPGGRVARAGLGAALAVPVLAVVAALLAAADPVFASIVVPDADPRGALGHVLLASTFAVVVVAAAAAAFGDADDRGPRGTLGVVEIATMLALAAAVVGLFVVSQLVALTGAGRRLVESSGLTPAEYARSGFFQLCWATAILVGFLGAVRSLGAPPVMTVRGVRMLAGAVPLLALGLVVVSLRRMALYDQAFGLTMLRVWVVGAAVWMGVVLVMMAVRSLGMGSERTWVTAAAGGVALALLMVANVVNVEGFVVRHNVDRATGGAELDLEYLHGLSDDAVPALGEAGLVAALRCGDDAEGVAALNAAALQAAAVRRQFCPK